LSPSIISGAYILELASVASAKQKLDDPKTIVKKNARIVMFVDIEI
jgi:hypothetical protein